MPDLKGFYWRAASAADAADVNVHGIKTLLANGLNTFSIKGNQFLVMVLKTDVKPSWLSYFMQFIYL